MRLLIHTLSLILLLASASTTYGQSQEKTCFQTARGWVPELDLRSDVAIVYGVNPSFPQRVQSWQERGYITHMMTGVAWGNYQDYINGDFDGKNHLDEGQVARDGTMIMHNPTVPYMVPTPSYIAYLKSLVKTAIDEGVEAIHLEEPEFWNRAGYSEGFKREWQAYYDEPWQAQHLSPEATYRSAKLKYHLYFRALKELFVYAKDYSESKGQRVRCYVPTHTLINYSAWSIVSPESSLSALPGMDGYIAQVWTGTSRTPVVYRGVEKERTFENAFLEYGSMVAMTRPTGRRVYFLTDPIEDNPDHTWEDYKLNYEATFTAQLLHPSVANYEVMPWPSRIFTGKYRSGDSGEREGIPAPYACEILVLINALNEMKAEEKALEGTGGVGVLLSDTMMFQRFPTHGDRDDRRLSNFYGMALPLLKHGVPVELVQMENLPFDETLKDIRVLFMSYAHMKPLKPEYHEILAEWVKNGGHLFYFGRDDDPFQRIREWWNQDMEFDAPSQHLFQAMQHESPEGDEAFGYGEGTCTVIRQDPIELAHDDGPSPVIAFTKEKIGESGNGWTEKNYFHLERGAYDVVAVLDESVSDAPHVVDGPLIDLFNPELPVLNRISFLPGERAFLLNLNRVTKTPPCILAASSRADLETFEDGVYRLRMKSPSGTRGIARLLLTEEPGEIQATDSDGESIDLQPQWDDETKTLLIRYPNQPDGVEIQIKNG